MALAIHLKELGLAFRQNVKVTYGRRWEWDFFLPDHRMAIEVDGFFKGRHGAGWGSDYEKQNWGTVNGIRVLRFTSTEAKNGKAKAYLAELFRR